MARYIQPKPNAASVRADLTIADLEKAISEISETMKGPVGSIERQLLHHDRADLRARLAELKAAG
jgi:hypothetical protein